MANSAFNQNQFQILPNLGSLDLAYNNETVSSVLDPAASGSSFYAGQAVKIMDGTSKMIIVEACDADDDECFGFIVFDRMHPTFHGGDRCEVAQAMNIMYLYATTTVAKGEQVTLVVSEIGGVASADKGHNIVGYAIDHATTNGLIRVKLLTPSFHKA